MNPSLRFIHLFCNDLNEIREFYTKLMQLNEVYFEEDDSVAYHCDQLQFSFSQTDVKLPVSNGWAIQPGWEGGELPITSWSIEYDKVKFKEAVERLLKAKVECFNKNPVWKGYWGFVVKDPAGNTVELSLPDKRDSYEIK